MQDQLPTLHPIINKQNKTNKNKPKQCNNEIFYNLYACQNTIHLCCTYFTWILIGVLCKRCWCKDFLFNSQASSVVNSGVSTWSMGSVVRVSPSNFVSTMILCRGRLGNLRPECITKFSHKKHFTNLKYGQFNPEVRRKLKDFLTNLPSRTETTTKIPSLSPIYTRLNYQ